jgi:hypothetical protein
MAKAGRTGRLSLGFGILVLLSLRADPLAQGPSLYVAAGSGINSVPGAECTGCTPFQFPPHARLGLRFRKDHLIGTEFSFVRSRLSPLFSRDEELRDRHERFKLLYRLDFSLGETGPLSLGPDLFYQTGRSRYSRTGKDQITYTGSIHAEYAFLGVGLALEKAFWRFLGVGFGAAYLSELARARTGELLVSDGGEAFRPVKVGEGGSHLEAGIHARIQFDIPL